MEIELPKVLVHNYARTTIGYGTRKELLHKELPPELFVYHLKDAWLHVKLEFDLEIISVGHLCHVLFILE